jgi:para-aminobenzoate synthetase / 4-amino-4-deoxychorismate lyase
MRQMIKTNEVLLKSGRDWLHYADPHQILSTKDIHQVRQVLQQVEALVEEHGWHAAGFVSYEAAPAFDDALQVVKFTDFPLLWFGLYSEPHKVEIPSLTGDLELQTWQPSIGREGYNTSIEKIKEYIALGRTYQVNYTLRLQTKLSADAWTFFLNLAKDQNKYAAFLNMEEYAVCSASPELFFKLDGERIYSQPMKGTAKRGRTTAEDKQQAEWLHHSVKNRAENVMIVDMIRNDIGRIAEVGSVQVPELFKVEKYPTLFQMTSTVQAKTGASITEIFSALFPCASITGAPKVSTMKIISELETTPRKIYTGSIGLISPGRRAQFNVAIRTVLIDKRSTFAEYGVGGGIVWDSTNTGEYDEALLKSQVLTSTQEDFSLLETLLWTPGEGYFLRERHIARMGDTAEYFDFPFSDRELSTLLNEAEKGFKSPQRLRILLDRFGRLSLQTADFTENKKPLKVKLAETPIDSSDPFLFHKTTNRGMYPSAPGFDDILLFNERGELTEFTIGNLVAEIKGKFLTPPVSCGLLAGTFRSHLLESGQISEGILHRDDLKNFEKIYLINSVRKWVQVEI